MILEEDHEIRQCLTIGKIQLKEHTKKKNTLCVRCLIRNVKHFYLFKKVKYYGNTENINIRMKQEILKGKSRKLAMTFSKFL